MKPKSFLKRYAVLAAVVLLCCGALLINSNARAQCPDSTGPGPNPSSVPWNYDSAYVQMSGTGCYVTLYFCYREFGDTVQSFLDGVVPDSGADCDSVPPDSMIRFGRDFLDSLVVGADYLNILEPCIKNKLVIVESFLPQCWQMTEIVTAGPGRQGTNGYFPCSNFQYWCVETCKACWNASPPGVVIEDCTIDSSPYTMELCQPLSVPPTPWSIGLCYTIDCGSPGQ